MAATKSKIKIKQNKKGAYIDLSQENLLADNFTEDFNNYLTETSDFLTGNSVSLIIPAAIDLDQELSTEFSEIIQKIKLELNQRNISLKSLSKPNSEENIDAKFIDPETTEKRQRAQAEIVSQLPETLYIKHNLRSGQLVRYPGNIIVIGDVNPQAEIIASGDIVIWGALRGIAHAGVQGDETAIVAAHRLDCGQLRIADKMIAMSTKINKAKKFLGDKKNISPEIARIVDNEIRIFKN